MKSILVCILLLSFYLTPFTQTAQSGNSNYLEFNSVDFGSSSFRLQTQSYSIDEFRSLMLTPKLDFINANDFQSSESTTGSLSRTIQVGVGFHVKSKKDNLIGNPLVRFGLGYAQTNLHYGRFRSNSTTTIDSVFVPNSSVRRPLDSIHNATLTIRSEQAFLNLSASILWQTDPELRFCLYGGVGVGFGVTTSSRISMTYNQDTYKEVLYSNGATYQRYDYEYVYQREWSDAQPWHIVSFNAPVGLDFRWGRIGRPLSYFHLFFELGPNFQILSAQALTPSNYYGLWISWGCRFRVFDQSLTRKNRMSAKINW
jgi:hypothetical protein